MNFDLKANALGLVLKTIGIEPTPEGLLKAFKLEPATVFGIAEMIQREAPGFIEWAQKEAPALVQKIEGFDARIARIELLLAHVVKAQSADQQFYHDSDGIARARQGLPPEVTAALLAAAGA